MFFLTNGKSFCISFYNKGGELGAVNFGKHGVYICKTTVRYPAFLAIEQVMLSIGAKRGRGFGA